MPFSKRKKGEEKEKRNEEIMTSTFLKFPLGGTGLKESTGLRRSKEDSFDSQHWPSLEGRPRPLEFFKSNPI